MPDAPPQVTVLLPVGDSANQVEFAVESLLTQSYPDFEILVIEDVTSDATHEILLSFADERIRLLRHREKQGIVATLNEGLKAARGEYVARQGPDDVSMPDRLVKQVSFLKDHPEVGLLGTSYAKISMSGQILVKKTLPTADDAIRRHMESGNCFCHGSVMIRRSCLERSGVYRNTTGPMENYDLWLRLLEVTRAANLPEVLYHWCVTPSGEIENLSPEGVEACRALVWRIATLRRKRGKDPLEAGDPEIRDSSERVKKLLEVSALLSEERARAAFNLNLARDHWANGEGKKALGWVGRSITANLFWPESWLLGMEILYRSLFPRKKEEPAGGTSPSRNPSR
jgi:glycosyltransferase involved in cell wall biosynthesis